MCATVVGWNRLVARSLRSFLFVLQDVLDCRAELLAFLQRQAWSVRRVAEL